MIVYEIKRGDDVLAAVKPTGAREERIMAGDVVNMSFKLNHYVDFLKGDTAIVDGELFVLQKPSDFEQDGVWTYNLNFLKDAELSRAGMLALDENNELSEYDCFYTGNASNAIDLIIANANRISPGFTKGNVDETEVKDFDFTGDNCATALAKLANAHNIEFWVENKKIHLTKKGADSGLSFRRGKGKGLIKLIRRTQDNKPVTRLHVYGSKQNLSTTYPGLSKRLRMPGGQKYIQDQSKVDKYGLEEDTILLDEIFPKRVGTVTAVAGAFTFTDSAIDFDLNAHLVDKVAAKVKFTTGRLAGYQFEIKEKGYNHSTKTITILINKDETAMEVPSAASGMVPVVGDQYILIDVIMPHIDITKAEIELKAKATEKYYESSDPRVIFDAPTDRRYLREFNVFVKLGDFVTIQAPEANVDQRIRVISKTTNLQDKWDLTLELSESVSVAGIVKQLIAESNIQKAVKNAKITDVARQRLMWRTTTELTTMLDTLRAEMLLIMVKGGNYQTDIQVETSVDQDPHKFTTSTGSVEHQEYIENGGHWNVSAFSGLLPTASAYYVYIQASRTSTAATIVYSLNKIDVDTDPLNYYFPFGIISSVIDGTRIFSTTKGFTVITGNNIKTGIIEGPSGELIINMETGQIFGKITFKGSNGAIKDIKNVDDTANLAIDNAAAADGKAIAAQTAADAAKLTADNALTDASTAQASANAANAALIDIANDNLLMPAEKQEVLKEWLIINSEQPVIMSQATNYNISTSDYTDNYYLLSDYINPLLLNMTVNSAIDGVVFRATFKGYYDAKIRLLKAVSDKAKQLADSAQGTANSATTKADAAQTMADNAQSLANSKKRNFVVQPFTPYDIGDFWTNGTDLFRCIVARSSGIFQSDDWAKATVYDSTQVTIDNGVVTGGTVQLGNTGGINAGITGAGGLATDIRFWAGSAFANRDTAPFRVDQSGKVWMSNANVDGILNAGPGSKIGDVMIDAAGKFNLAGSKVEVIPDQLIRVYNGGEADFSGASKMIIPTTGSRKWKIYIDEAGAGGGAVAPPVISSLWDLTNTLRSGSEQNNQALLFDLATGKWMNKTINVDMSPYALKSYVDSNFAPRDGVGAFGTWGINTSGSAKFWGAGNEIVSAYIPAINNAMIGFGADGKWGYVSKSVTQTHLDINNGTNLNNNISGSSALSYNSAQWNGYDFDKSNAYGSGFDLIFGRSSGINEARLITQSGMQNYVGTNNGSTLNNSISGNSESATYWGGRPADLNTVQNTFDYFLTRSGDGGVRLSDVSGVQTKLGLGSFAYRNGINGNEVGTDVASAGADIGVAKLLRWKNYANGHVIFDASAGTSPTGSAINPNNSAGVWNSTYPTLMGWNGAETYGVRVDSARQADGAILWNGYANGFADPISGSTIDAIVGQYNDGRFYRFNATALRLFQGSPAGGETLPSVLARESTGQNGQVISLRATDPSNGYFEIKNIYNQYNTAFRLIGGVWALSNDGFSIYNSNGTTPFFIDQTGNIHVGYTTNQGYKFAVNGSFNARPGLNNNLAILNNGTDGVVIGTHNDANNLNVKLRFDASYFNFNGGNVGVDYPTNQGYRFAVNGNGYFASDIYTGASVQASGAVLGLRGVFGYDSGNPGSVNASNWFRSNGNTGWINESYGGGLYMSDSTWIRTYNNAGIYSGSMIQAGLRFETTGHYKCFGLYGMVGDYDTAGTTDKIIWTIGDAWNSIANMYGIGYQYNSKYGTSHQIVFRVAGNVKASIVLDTGSAHFDGMVTAPIVKATSKLLIPSTSGKQWSLYVQDN